MDTSTIDIWTIVVNLLGGLAIFLFGLDQLTSMLKATAGARMRDILAQVTTNRFKAVAAGGFTTAVIQSSSVTTVLVIGFVSAGLMSVQQSIGVIMGAEIGTTITAQIIAFKITKYALVAVVAGFAMQLLIANEQAKRYGTMILGLGLVFYGMNMMGDATRPLRDYQPFIDVLARMDNPVLAILLSAAFTAVIQSSSATVGVIIVLGSQGLISLEQGISLVLGANIGTCVTALLATIGKPRETLRPALIHLTFNVSGVLLWFGFIDELAALARWISPSARDLPGAERIAADMPRQIANAHTIFNVGNTLVFIWFTGAFAWFSSKILPAKERAGRAGIQPRFLNATLIETPTLALDAARMEVVRLAGYVLPMVRDAGPAVLAGTYADLDRLRNRDTNVDLLHAAILKYLGRVSREELTPQEADTLNDLLSAATLYESIGDVVETDLVHVGTERLTHGVRVSRETQEELNNLATHVIWTLETATEAIDRDDRHLAMKVIETKADVNQLADRVSERLVKRLVAEEPHRTSTYRVESQVIEHFKRIYYFSKRIAKIVADTEAESRGTTPAPAKNVA
ncbi:MAG: Na/Pi cotransporter family protein [Chromatiales bacterium]|nr:MAG: Na/Pi cotransporter family protein [Chromatiales bacterium]